MLGFFVAVILLLIMLAGGIYLTFFTKNLTCFIDRLCIRYKDRYLELAGWDPSPGKHPVLERIRFIGFRITGIITLVATLAMSGYFFIPIAIVSFDFY